MREVACILDNVVVRSYIHVRLVNNAISGINTSPDAIISLIESIGRIQLLGLIGLIKLDLISLVSLSIELSN